MAQAAQVCECPTNEIGDVRCHVCGEYVNVRCWNCKTPRGEGSCPNPAKHVPRCVLCGSEAIHDAPARRYVHEDPAVSLDVDHAARVIPVRTSPGVNDGE